LEDKVFRYILVLAVFACIATSCGSNNVSLNEQPTRNVSAIVDATNAWNSVCFQYHFIPKPFDTTTTFSQGYYGQNYLVDSLAITTRVNQMVGLLGASAPTDGSDVMKTKIENWGILGGGL